MEYVVYNEETNMRRNGSTQKEVLARWPDNRVTG